MTASKLKVISVTDGSRPSHVDANSTVSQGGAATLEAVGRNALTALDGLLHEFMDRVDDAFFERSDKARNQQERKRYFDAMREFRNQRDDLQVYFARQMKRSLAELARHSTYAAGHDDITRIEIAGTEDRTAIDNLISRARLKFAGDLSEVTAGVKALLGMTELDRDDNPFDPGPICENFHAACALLQIDIAIRLIFYKLFEKHLMAGLVGFYRELNRQFTEQGVLPAISAGNTRDHSASAAAKPAGRGKSLVAALTRLQKAADINHSPSSVDPSKFRHSIRQQVDALCRQNRQYLSPRDTKTVEAVAMLFDFFYDDEALPDPIKVLIGRLQVPILKVAIIEPDFLTRKQHAARRLLDTVSRASLGYSDDPQHTRLLIGKTREVVDFIVARYAEDAVVFDKACGDFESFVVRESEKRDRAEAAVREREQQRDQQISLAREAAATLIGRLIAGRELNAEIVEFLHTTWTSVLVRTYLSLGDSSNHWRNLKRISTTLVWTLIPRHTEAERDKIIRTIPALLRALSKGMALIRTDMHVQNRVFAVLAREHARVVKQTSRNIVTRIDDITVWPEDEAERALAMTGNIDEQEIAVTCVDPDRIDADADAISLIDSIGTNEVIKNLNQFTSGVSKGSIRIDEEIVLSGEDEIEFELEEGTSDKYLELANELRTGSWVEFARPDDSRQLLKLAWKSAAAGTLVFVNSNGQKVKNMTVNDFAAELRAKSVRCARSSSPVDRAFFRIATKLDER
jgi:hypothetical protein